MRDNKSNSRFDLRDISPQGCCDRRCTSDSSMVDMINSVCTKGEDFCQPSADFINQQHQPQCTIAVESCFTTRSNGHRIKVIVTKLTGYPPSIFIEAKICSVRIPLAHGRDICRYTSSCLNRGFLAKTDATDLVCTWTCSKGFATQHGARIGPMVNSRDSAANTIEMETFNQAECL